MSLPSVGIILLTYERTEYAVKTVQGINKNLRYDGPLGWYLADDGSRGEHYSSVRAEIDRGNIPLWGEHQTENQGYGYSANKAWQTLMDQRHVHITLWMEDDWVLQRPLDITPYVNLLHHNQPEKLNERVGMVRLGHMPIDMNLRSCGYNGRMYLDVSKQQQYTYSGNPHLKHSRFLYHYGGMPENLNPGETEVAYDHTIRNTQGPRILWPLGIGDHPYFAHIGAEQSYV